MKKILFILVLIFLIIWSFGIEPNMLTVKEYIIKDADLKGLKVVFASDFHITPNQHKRLAKMVNLINAQNADLILSTGDFVAGNEEKATMPIENIAAELKNIKSKYGFYTVLGNHDWWINGEKITKVLTQNNIVVLENSNIKINVNGKALYVAGVADKKTRVPDIDKALKNTRKPTILLTHSPDVFVDVSQNVNLTFAGHVHGGQVRLPIIGATIIPSDYGNKYSQGLIVENDKKMIVTKGIGNSTLPVRFNCIPEITVINFE